MMTDIEKKLKSLMHFLSTFVQQMNEDVLAEFTRNKNSSGTCGTSVNDCLQLQSEPFFPMIEPGFYRNEENNCIVSVLTQEKETGILAIEILTEDISRLNIQLISANLFVLFFTPIPNNELPIPK